MLEKRADMLPYGSQWIDEDDIEAVVKVLKSDFITQGPAIADFENAVAAYVGARYAVAFCNGTAALHAACYAAGIGPGDEVVTTPITFLASSNCALYMGAKVVFADIDPHTYNIDPDEIETAITDRTKAIIAVDLTGQPAEMDRILMLAKDRGIAVIHDAAHSLGASYGGSKVGTFGDMTMFSFHPVKHVTTGEGGVIVTDDERLKTALQMFRNHGMTRDSNLLTRNGEPWYYEMQALGYNYRMTDMQAALGLSQLSKLDGFVRRRREIAARYNAAFEEMADVVLPRQHPLAESSWHLYVIRVNDRNAVFARLRDLNIGVNVHYIPIYKQPYYRGLGYRDDQCPRAEHYYETAITLPLFPKMSDGDVEDVIKAVQFAVNFNSTD
ncbi:UDP-4-amino-4,6-dideoxy-N-acetyl-beta-L-altrosamine transaminase [Cohnella sp. OV330]|uniref:UDP-4-amino-4, 6-dideoxy-N-acetyl-beta-L-altrosamine transaminase n=1 Tax=Cohnella sp. OV330 TaxID=1855288 RepID=UPI0008F2F343|nr:UDP-4-amino-4,6-dideoxy-N-acetyl-beta-L-altrosamine transaminase [Cohnella sp. OV330]SFB48001.1 UDP-4-amino-4,6-dideoxy-N-acetyl-beta-L-altrosamine transaminase [Cohnella sp. OV330]